MTARRVMIIGLDGCTLDLVRPWAAEGRLPNLARFLEAGAWGPLRSTLPATSLAAWSTFATGVNPGKHGILDFLQLAPDSYESRLHDTSALGPATFWELAGAEGTGGGIINVPCIYPPRPFNGFCISGLLTPGLGPGMASPPEAFDDLMAASPSYAIDVDVVKAGGERAREHFLDRIVEVAQARLEAALGLYRKHRPPLFCVVFTASDRVCHRFWHDMEEAGPTGERAGWAAGAIRMVYAKLDEAVGALTAEAGEGTDVLVLSDHGAGPLRSGLNLRRALSAAGLLTELEPGLIRRATRAATSAFARTAPRALKNRLRVRLPWLARRAGGLLVCSGVDFARTRAYPAGNMGGVFVNLKGRQPSGIVEPGAQYEAVRTEVAAFLCALRDPGTGKPVVRAAHRREDAWSGPFLGELPDVILELDDETYEVAGTTRRGQEVLYSLGEPGTTGWRRSGGHRRLGLLLAKGPHVRQAEIPAADMADVPATVLALLRCPIPEDFDGRVLNELLTDDMEPPGRAPAAASHEPGRGLSRGERAAVERRLEGLGYL
jgi:predicted AlkP superfamily phosphohydrolase/phosphomutase